GEKTYTACGATPTGLSARGVDLSPSFSWGLFTENASGVGNSSRSPFHTASKGEGSRYTKVAAATLLPSPLERGRG
ncbi:MAG: hypothetical protein LBL94_04780, partial [Prevotellaceae bacterium]|nr:hypothetical protein [Prevotellaceae bacterium]